MLLGLSNGLPVRVLDLFSGIGGFSLGLERAGMRTVGFCEIDPYCRAVLAKHWPSIPCAHDIRTVHFDRDEADVLCGGFPCQDISVAGRGAGLSGERSGLWADFARAIGEVRPRYVIVENVSALLHRGLGDVLGDLASIGYDAEWHCIPAATVGAPHRRDRIWIVAYPAVLQRPAQLGSEPDGDRERSETLADADDQGQLQPRGPLIEVWRWLGDGSPVGDSVRQGLPEREESTRKAGEANGGLTRNLPAISGQWAVEPDVGRMAHGVPRRVDRLRCLGNAIVPQIAEIIGRAIMRAST